MEPMPDSEKLEAIKKVLDDTPARQRSYRVTAWDFEKALNEIKEILEKKTLTDYEKLVEDIKMEITHLELSGKPTKANYEMTIQRIKKRIKYPNLPRGIGGMESLEKSIRRRIVLLEERTKLKKKDYENTIHQIDELINDPSFQGKILF